MRTSRLHTPHQTLKVGAELTLSKDQLHYLTQVLRLKTDAQVQAFDGAGQRAETLLQKDRLLVQSTDNTPAPPCRFVLGLGISQRERMEYAIQKSTELGVAEIVPLVSRYSEWKLSGARAKQRIEYWQCIAISACEQSGQDYIPLLHQPASPPACPTGRRTCRLIWRYCWIPKALNR